MHSTECHSIYVQCFDTVVWWLDLMVVINEVNFTLSPISSWEVDSLWVSKRSCYINSHRGHLSLAIPVHEGTVNFGDSYGHCWE